MHQETEVSFDYCRNEALVLVAQGKSLSGPCSRLTRVLICSERHFNGDGIASPFRRSFLPSSLYLPNTLTSAKRRMSAMAIDTILDALPITPAIVAERFTEEH